MSSAYPSGKPIKVMVASTMEDLKPYRSLALDILGDVFSTREVTWQPIAMERKTSDGEVMLPVMTSREWVDDADWVIVIVGFTYGFISEEPGAGGLSVTQWEYRYARDPGKKKKIFVFIADKSRYRRTDENKSLFEFGMDESDENKKKLENFRTELCDKPFQRFVKFFADLAEFREQLRDTISIEIDKLVIDVEPGGRLAKLVVSLRRPFNDCIERVERLAGCKAVHDALHDILHKGVRRLHDEVLPTWHRDKELGIKIERRLSARWHYIGKRLGALEERGSNLRTLRKGRATDGSKLLTSIEALKTNFEQLWDPEANEQPDVGEFTDRLDILAACAEKAFKEADGDMTHEEKALSENYVKLMQTIGVAQTDKQLTAEEQAQLDTAKKRADGNKQRLADILQSHHAWQDMHERFRAVANQRGYRSFGHEMKKFSQLHLSDLETLLHAESGLPLVETAAPAQSDGGAGREPAATGNGNPDDQRADAERLLPLIPRFKKAVNASGDEPLPVDTFDEMLSRFEVMFYQVDKRTLHAMNRSRDRVNAFRDLLESLVDAHSNAA